MKIAERIAQMHRELILLRHDLHAHPELAFEENRTSDLIAEKLAGFGIQVNRNICRTGVVGVLKQGTGQGSIALRADMDALPIQEENRFAYKSRYDGKMHACGHDGHVAMLLGAAQYLAETQHFNGTVCFIFQPAEEVGGAKAMIQEGLFDKFPCDAVFGMHNRPNLPVGRFAVHFGPMMAAGAFFDIHITGMGAHGARPETSIDPVMVASHIAVSLQTIISRSLPPLEAAVLSITKIQAGNAYNVIPQTAHLAGTVRSFSYTVMEKIEEKMKQIVRGVASALGAKAEMEFRITFAPTVNDPKEAAFAADICSQVVGTENVNQKPSLVMGSEDFSFMLEKVPGCFINIGTGGKNTRNRKVHEVHHPSYDFNDAAIPLGVEFFVRLVEARLAQNASTHDDATA